MAKWNPETDPVHKNEIIGRRLFDEPMLMGATQQPRFDGIDLRHFQETRGDRQLSLDRLGPTGIVKKAKDYLIRRAEHAATMFTPSKSFNGWYVVSAKHLEEGCAGYKFPVIASPQEGTGLEQNIYHAHTELPANTLPLSVALHVRHIFATKGKIEQHGGGTWADLACLKISQVWEKIKQIRAVFRQLV